MNETFELDDLLTGANPVDERHLTDPAQSPFARRLFRRITGSPYHRRTARVRLRRQGYLAVALAVLGSGAGVAYALVANQPSKRLSVACYSEARIDASSAVVLGTGSDPIAICRAAELQGQIPGMKVAADQLEACLLPSGVVGVFPRPDPAIDSCQQLDLPAAASGTGRSAGTQSAGTQSAGHGDTPATLPPVTADTAATLIETVVHALSPGCFDATQAKARVEDALIRAGFGSWTVAARGTFTAARPCASPGFDEPTREVFLIPVPAGG